MMNAVVPLITIAMAIAASTGPTPDQLKAPVRETTRVPKQATPAIVSTGAGRQGCRRPGPAE